MRNIALLLIVHSSTTKMMLWMVFVVVITTLLTASWCDNNVGTYDDVGTGTRCTSHAQCQCVDVIRTVFCQNKDIDTLPRPYGYWGGLIRHMDLSNNKIKELKTSTLYAWSGLKSWDLTGNPLSSRSCDTLQRYLDRYHGTRSVMSDCER